MKKWVFTFGSGQEYAGYCQPIYATSWMKARVLMIGKYGAEWSMQYEGDKWEEYKEDPNIQAMLEEELDPIYESKEALK